MPNRTSAWLAVRSTEVLFTENPKALELPANTTGSDVLPPLASRVSWEAVAISYSLLVLVFIATNMSLVVAYSRLAVHRALRMGEL